jgi:hypothetical protein
MFANLRPFFTNQLKLNDFKTIAVEDSKAQSNNVLKTTDQLIKLPIPPFYESHSGKTLLKTFSSRDECQKYLNDFCRGEVDSEGNQPSGYALNIKRSSGVGRRCYFMCDCGQLPRQKEDTMTFRVSRKTNCPFLLYARDGKDGVWKVDIINEFHNHQKSEGVEVHAALRRKRKLEMSDRTVCSHDEVVCKFCKKKMDMKCNNVATNEDIVKLK